MSVNRSIVISAIYTLKRTCRTIYFVNSFLKNGISMINESNTGTLLNKINILELNYNIISDIEIQNKNMG